MHRTLSAPAIVAVVAITLTALLQAKPPEHHPEHHAPHRVQHHHGFHSHYHHGTWHGHHDHLHSWHRGHWSGWNAWPRMWGTGAGHGWAANHYVYHNPFWSHTFAGPVNYAQPITTSSYAAQGPNASAVAANQGALTEQPLASDENETMGPTEGQKQAIAQLDQGREAFRAGHYAQAQKLAEKAIAGFPEDVTAHEFRALTLFAQKKYHESAAATYAVLAGGPGWNEETLMSFYPDHKTYDAQLTDLKHYVKQDPKAADGEFLLAYHQLTAGHRDAARAELEQVAKLEPKDQLTSELLKALEAKAS